MQIAADELGLQTSADLQVRAGDARLGIRDAGDHSYDLVIGDAFGGVAVPWHLTTREFIEQVARAMRPDGVYAINVIDHPPLAFAKAEAATLSTVFEHVAVLAAPDCLAGTVGGNMILIASHQPIDVPTILAHNRSGGDGDAIMIVDEGSAFITGAPGSDRRFRAGRPVVQTRPAVGPMNRAGLRSSPIFLIGLVLEVFELSPPPARTR